MVDFYLEGRRLSWSFVESEHIPDSLRSSTREQLLEFLYGWSTGGSDCFAGMYGIRQGFARELARELIRADIKHEFIYGESRNYLWELRILGK